MKSMTCRLTAMWYYGSGGLPAALWSSPIRIFLLPVEQSEE